MRTKTNHTHTHTHTNTHTAYLAPSLLVPDLDLILHVYSQLVLAGQRPLQASSVRCGVLGGRVQADLSSVDATEGEGSMVSH